MQLLRCLSGKHRWTKVIERTVICAVCERTCYEKYRLYCDFCHKETKTFDEQYCNYVTITHAVRGYYDAHGWHCELHNISFCENCLRKYIEPEVSKMEKLCRDYEPPVDPCMTVWFITATMLSRALEEADRHGLEVYGPRHWFEEKKEGGGVAYTNIYYYSYYIYDREKDKCVQVSITVMHFYVSLMLRAKALSNAPFNWSKHLAEWAYWRYTSRSPYSMTPEKILREVEQRDTENVNKVLRELLCA